MPVTLDARWQRLSEHLDQILDLSEAGRSDYLADLASSDPETARSLADVLGAADREGFSDFLVGSSALSADTFVASTLIGRTVGSYVIDVEIGRGGMGSVWRARRADGRFEGTVAIKLVHAAWIGGAGEQRFRIEGNLLGQLNHGNIARLIDAGVLDGTQPYLVLEYVEGEPIDAYCNRHNLDAEARITLFLAILAAVAHAHSHLIVHRDIKPANVFVAHDGTVKLLDFGIAKLIGDAAGAAALTKPSAMALTPQYAAPEQLLGQPVTTGTDVYALGLVLYVLLTGKHPVAIESLSNIDFIRTVVTEDAPLASSMATISGISGRHLEGDLDNILRKALKKNPVERYVSVDAFADDLRRFLAHEPVLARPDSVSYRVGKFVRRHRGGVAVTALIAAILVAATIVTFLQKLEADRQRETAVAQSAKAESSSLFLNQMVAEIGAEGGALKPTQILDRGIYLLDHRLDQNSREMVDELLEMATFYADLFEVQKEQEVFTRAETLARRLSYTEGLISAQCDLVDTELTLEHRDRAQIRLADAQRLLAGLRRPAPPLQVKVEEAAANVEAANDRNEGAIKHGERALEILRASGNINGLNYPAVLTRLSMYHDRLGHAVEAHRYTLLASQAYERIGASGTLNYLTTLNNEAADLTNFGELHAALAASTEVMRRLEERGAGAALRVPFRTNYGAKLAAIGRYPEALSALDQAIADARLSDNPYWQQRAELFRARTLVLAGRYADAKPALDDIERAYRVDEVMNRGSLQSIAVCRAEWLLHTGAARAAQRELDRLLMEIGFPAQNSQPVLRTALPLAAEIALALRDWAGAQAYALAGVEYARKVARDATQSADVGRALVVLARAQHEGGQDAAALQTLRQAVPALSAGLGADHVEVGSAQALLSTWSQHAATAGNLR
jgi:serine/threonine protein kinase